MANEGNGVSLLRAQCDVKPVTWNWFALRGDDPRPLFSFAGVWRRHRGPIEKDGPVVELDVTRS